MICTSGTFTVTLPAPTSGHIVAVKNVGSGRITVDGAGANTIDDGLTVILGRYDAVICSHSIVRTLTLI